MTETYKVEPLVIEGRTFRALTTTTFEQDLFIMRRMKEARIPALIDEATKHPERLDEITSDIILVAYESGVLFELMGGIYLEDGKKWSVKGSLANAEFFMNITDQEEKQKLTEPITAVIVGFFMNARGSSTILLSSSASSEKPESVATSSTFAPLMSETESTVILEPENSASGETSFDISHDTTADNTPAS